MRTIPVFDHDYSFYQTGVRISGQDKCYVKLNLKGKKAIFQRFEELELVDLN